MHPITPQVDVVDTFQSVCFMSVICSRLKVKHFQFLRLLTGSIPQHSGPPSLIIPVCCLAFLGILQKVKERIAPNSNSLFDFLLS